MLHMVFDFVVDTLNHLAPAFPTPALRENGDRENGDRENGDENGDRRDEPHFRSRSRT